MAEIVAKMNNMNKNEKTLFLKTLSAEEHLKYLRFRNNERQAKYKEDPEKKALANERANKIMKKNREENPEKYKEMNRQYNKEYNTRKQTIDLLAKIDKEILKKALDLKNK